MKFISQVGQKARALDVADGKNADGTNVQLYEDDNTAAQKFHLKMMEDGGYQILARCSGDVRALDISGGSLDNKANVEIDTAGDETNAAQIWYFEPADEGEVSDAPKAGVFFRLRARHSGQYLMLEDSADAVGKKLQQKYASGGEQEKFILTDAGDNYYYIRPMHAPDKYLDISTTGSDGFYRVTLRDTTPSDSKKFRFVKTGTGYAVENKNRLQLDVMHSSFTSGTDVIGTGTDGSPLAANKIFLIENDSCHFVSSMAYSADGRNITSVTDARGYTTESRYDSDNRLLTQVTDAKGNRTSYEYLAATDQLSGVSSTVNGQERAVRYSYDSGDRLKSVSHNGTVYDYTYDVFGNPKTVSAGKSTLGSRKVRTAYRYG